MINNKKNNNKESNKENINIVRHSLAHILALAVKELFKTNIKFGIGPVIEDGFYYDFDNLKISDNDLEKIEEKMRDLIKKNIVFKKRLVAKNQAKKIFKDQPYKLEILSELKKEKKINLYESDNFIDLCRGPHIKSTKEIPIDAFKLIKTAGAYWKGEEKNPMLTRVYGVAFESKEKLEEYLKIQKEAEKRDHRLLGQKLELFIFDQEVGVGLPLWLPKGATLRKQIQDYLIEELSKENYQWISTPHIGNLKLWKTSGHWELYRENIYSPIKIDEEEYLLKPMNCPFHVKIFKSKIRSYKELPLKFAEFGTVYRYEKSGVLHGLTRVRGFTQDDAHVFCVPDKISDETEKLLQHGLKILRSFGFKKFDIYLSTRPQKYAGTEKMWQKATNCLKYVLKKLNLNYEIDPEGGVFYGPKIDIKIKDALNRSWQCTTIQVDFNLPEKFDVNFINEKGGKEKVVMIHRALIGSLERFIGVLIEHYAGALPFWLSPVQIWIIPLGSRHKDYAQKVKNELDLFRVEIKDENETVSKKIREAEVLKIPYVLVIGDKEINSKSVRIRKRGKGDIGMEKIDKFKEMIKKELEEKTNE